MYVGIVEALDVDWQHREFQRLLNTFQQVLVLALRLTLIGIDQGALMAALQLVSLDVAHGEFQQLETVATCWDGLFEIFFGQVGNAQGQHHLAGGAFGALVKGGDGGGENLLVGLVQLFLHLV